MGRQNLCRVLVTLVLTGWLSVSTVAQDAANASDTPGVDVGIPFSRVYLPLEEISRFGSDHIPVEYEKFESMVTAASHSATGRGSASDARTYVERANYSARFENGVLLDGAARLEVQRGASGPTELDLGDSNFPVSRPRWENNDFDTVPAVVGLGPAERQIAVVQQSGTLLFDWSRRGVQSGNGFLFQFELPPSLRSTISLVLPSAMQIVSPNRFVSKETESPQSNRWTLEVGSATSVPVVVARQQDSGNESLAIFDQSSRYEVAHQGIDAIAEIAIQVIDGVVNELRLEHGETARIKSLVVDGRETTLVASSPFDVDSPAGSLARLATPLLPGKHTATLVFSADLPDKSIWSVPDVQPSGMIWRSSSARLELVEPLTISRFQVNDGRQVEPETFPEPSADSEKRLQVAVEFHRPGGNVELGVRNIGTDIQGNTVSSITMGGQVTTAKVVTNLNASTGYCFELAGSINQLWSIDSLEVVPEGILEDWVVESNPNGRSRIQIQLAKPLSPNQPIKVVVDARRPLGPGRDLDYRSLEILRLNDVRSIDEFYAVRCLGSFQLQMKGNEEIAPLDPAEIPGEMAGLVNLNRGDYVFRGSEADDALAFAYARGRPQWDANVQVDAHVHSDFVREKYTAVCRTNSSAIEAVTLRISPARSESIRWTQEGSDQELTATRKKVGEGEYNAELWEVLIPESKAETITVVGNRTFEIFTENQTAVPLSIARATNATTQRSKTSVHAARELPTDYRVESQLESLPISPEPLDRSSDSIGSFLVPYRLSDPVREGAIRLVRGQESPTHRAWIRLAQTTTSVAAQGTLVHETNWDVENFGRESLKLRLPEGCTLRRVMLDDHQLMVASTTEAAATIPLPRGQRNVRLTIESSEQRSALAPFDYLAVALPDVDVPLLTREWKVNLPPRYRGWGSVGDGYTTTLASRMFGWAARTGTARTVSSWKGKVSEDNQGSLRIYDAGVVALIGWMVFLLLITASVWRSIPSRWFVILIGVFGCLLPICGMPFLAPLRGVFWGAMGAMFARSLPRTDRSLRGVGKQALRLFTKAAVPVGGTSLWLLAAILALSFSVVWAQPPLKQAAVKLQRVLFPVKDGGQPDGKYVYVPSAMYDQLVQVSESRKPVGQRWLLTSAVYSGELAPQGSESPLSIQRVSCTIGLETFRPGLTIRLPIPAPESFDEKVQLDGQPVDWTWSKSRDAIQFRVAQTGAHRVQYSRKLATGSVQSGYGFDCPVLPIPNSRMELTTTRDTQLGVVSALGESQTSEDSRRSVFLLGPANIADVRWRPTETTATSTNIALKLRTWMRVEPGVIRGESRFSRADGLPLRNLRVHVQPVVRPTTSAGLGDEQSLELVEKSLDRNTYLLTQNREQPYLVFPFVVLEATGVGELSLPRITVDDADTSDTQWAYSVADGLSYERIVGRATPQVSVAQFASEWGTEPANPDFALRIVDPGFPWKMKTYARQSSSLAEAQTSVYYSSDEIRLEFSADISPIEGDNFQVQLQVPEGIRDTRVEITQSDSLRPIEWSLDENNRVLHIFPHQAISGPHRVRLTGNVAPVEGEVQSVPLVRVVNSTVTFEEFNIFRDSSIRLQLMGDNDELQRQPSRQANLPTDDWQLVDSRIGTLNDLPEMFVRVTADATAVQGRMLVTLRQDLDGWWADVDYRVVFEDGTPDTIAFSIPESWGESLVTEPEVLTTIEELSVGRRRLVIRPALPADATAYQLKISGPIKGAQAVEVPRIIPIRQPLVRRWLGIPKTLRGQSARWETMNITPVEPPSEFQVDSRQFATYRIADGADAIAKLERVEEAAAKPRILLQDARIVFDDRGYSGQVEYAIESRGTAACRLDVPPGIELVAVVSQSAVIPVRKIDESTFSLPLGPQRLTQQLSIVFRAESGANVSVRKIQVPRFVEADTQSAVWMVARPPGVAKSLKAYRAQSVSLQELNRIRISTVLAALNSQAVDLASYSPEDVEAWYRRWSRIARTCRQTELVPGVDDELDRIADRLALSDDAVPPKTNLETRDLVSPSKADQFDCFSVRLGQPQLLLRAASVDWESLVQKVALSLSILLLSAVAGLLVAKPALEIVGYQWTYIVLALIGFVWILWLRIPWIGFILICFAVYYSLTAGRWAMRTAASIEV